MASVEGLNAVRGLQQGVLDDQNQQKRQEAALNAAELFKNGDIKGAIGTLAAVDPAHAATMLGLLGKIDPGSVQALSQAKSEGSTQGTYNVTTPAGANPRQLLDAKLAGAKDVAGIKAKSTSDSTQTFTDKTSGLTGFKSKSGKILGFIGPDGELHAPDELNGVKEQKQKDKNSNLVADASGQTLSPDQQQKPKLLPNQDIDSNGNTVAITPVQRKIIDSARKEFSTDTKELTKSIDNLTQAQRNIQDNIPGQGTIEKLRILKGVVSGRINQQEFQAFGKGQGLVNQIDNAISEAAGKGMSPKVQQLMSQMVNAALDVTSQEYDQHLKNAVDKNPDVDPLILKKRLASGGPTLHQAIVSKVSSLPATDQAAFNWAHDNPNDPRSKAILQQLSPSLK